MSNLAKKQCTPCKGGMPSLTKEAAAALLNDLSGWQIIQDHHLSKEFAFENFVTALEFVNSVGAVAEEQGHHPDIYLTWGKARIDIWTHKIDGITESDFILAAKIDNLCLTRTIHE